MSGPQDFKIEEVFESAVTIVKSLPQEGPFKPSDKLKLKLYALYKQATCGPNTTSKPRFYQIVEQYKWDAWMKLGDMPREEAMAKYIAELKDVMDSIPEDQADPEENKHFEEVLGKKFYDYWFNQWEQRSARRGQRLASADLYDTGGGGGGGSGGGECSTGSAGATAAASQGNGDTQSNSSDGSSVSMLEDTQSPERDGYKTPTSLEQSCSIVHDKQMSDQFAQAMLRLQDGLQRTESRLALLEEQMRQSMASIRLLESQTTPKRLAGEVSTAAPSSGRRRKSVTGRPGACAGKLLAYLGQVKTVHWFYLSYPILVYLILQAYERRRRSPASSLR